MRARIAPWRASAGVALCTSLLLGLAVYVAATGRLPLGTVNVFAWLIAGLALLLVRRPRDAVQLAIDWLPLFALLLLYTVARGAADSDSASAHYATQIGFDELLGAGTVPTVWLQDHLFSAGRPRWYDYATWATYVSYFIVPWLVLAALWRADRRAFRRLRARIVALVAMSCAIYAAYPAVPPWLAGALGRIPPTARTIGPTWEAVGLRPARALFETGGDVVNLVAAVPSLHAALPALLLIFFWPAGTRIRCLLAAYALAMGFVLVYSGEHFVFDIVSGWLLAAAVGLARRPRRWHARPSSRGVRARRRARSQLVVEKV